MFNASPCGNLKIVADYSGILIEVAVVASGSLEISANDIVSRLMRMLNKSLLVTAESSIYVEIVETPAEFRKSPPMLMRV